MSSRIDTAIDNEASLKDYFTLLKPGVMSLVVFTGFVGLWVAPARDALHPFVGIIAIIALALGSGAAGAFNMWYERDVDAKMKRTQNRPMPRGLISSDNALGFSIFATLVSLMMMGLATNWVAAGIMAFASFFYVVIYTVWLKPRTPQNIVIGGAAGAFPPMIGWAAVTGDVTLYSFLLFAIIFIWTPPHFWALALFANEDYKRADIPMMPVTKGERHTKIQMLVYTILLFPLTLAPWLLGYTGLVYGVSSIVLSGFFIVTAILTLRDNTHKSAKQMFGYSVFYLFALFGALVLDGWF
ncbi:MAG: heme o synthase [Bdellovibrionales bacterium]